MPEIDPQTPEDELVRLAVQGVVEAFGALYDRYLAAVFRFILYQVATQEDAEDLTETVFLKAFENLPGFRRERRLVSFRAWIYRIARNQVIDHYRKRRPDRSLESEGDLPAGDVSPEAAAQRAEDASAVQRAILSLEPPYREVIVCRFIQGLSPAETASVLGIRENTIRVQQHRGLEKIRAILMKAGDL